MASCSAILNLFIALALVNLSISEAAVATLPKFIAIKSSQFPNNGHVYYEELGVNVFSTLVKIEVERATSNINYVHLRFANFNRYRQRNAADGSVMADSNQPEENTSNPSCTLFEAIKVDNNGVFYLTHVQSGRRVVLDEATNTFKVEQNPNPNPNPSSGYMTSVNMETLVKLHSDVAFLSNNGRYLKAFINGANYLQFESNNACAFNTGHTVSQMPDGHVRIKSNRFDRFWRRSAPFLPILYYEWVLADSADATATDKNTLFWPVKVNDAAVALRNAGNNKFCKRFTALFLSNCLAAVDATITDVSTLRVKDLLLAERKIYNVAYQTEDYARIFNQVPYSAGNVTVVNNGDQEASIAVSITYQDVRTYAFDHTLSVQGMVPTSIQGNTIFIDSASPPSFNEDYTINEALVWGQVKTLQETVTATGAVTVPARSSAVVSYKGTRGRLNVPFSYTQSDVKSTGLAEPSDQNDGTYTSVNSYGLSFVVESTQPL